MSPLKKNSIWLKKFFSVSIFFRIVLCITLFLALYLGDYVWVFGSIFALFLSFLPTLIKHDIHFTLPWIFDFLFVIIVMLHIGGSLLDFYIMIPFYFHITRFIFSSFIAFLSFTFVYILDVYWDGLKMNKYAMAFVVVISTMSIGVIFEFFRFFYMQISNHALMIILTVDTLAGIIIAVVGVQFIKSGRFDEFTKDFGQQFNESVIKKT